MGERASVRHRHCDIRGREREEERRRGTKFNKATLDGRKKFKDAKRTEAEVGGATNDNGQSEDKPREGGREEEGENKEKFNGAFAPRKSDK